MRLLALLATVLGLIAGCGTTAVTPAPAPQPAPASPAYIEIDTLGVTSTLDPLGLNPDGTIEVPPVTEPEQAGYYTHGPAPGEVGPAVILGHVDGGGVEGVFHDLHDLDVGDEIEIGRTDGTVIEFAVTEIEQVDKDAFPTDRVYGDTASPELRLITCTGPFDTGEDSYTDNLIVYAELTAA